jgi:8-oxo-dGTP diphosphatase
MTATRAQPLHVVAAVLRDGDGRVLLAQRGRGADLAGLWEFPGGKREAGESSLQALRRELWEELGITLDGAEPLIEVPHAYGHKRIALEVFTALAWRGEARGREGQALAWLTPEQLGARPMPAADRPVLAALQQPDRYLITPEPDADLTSWLGSLARALASGARRVQLRARSMDSEAFAELARQVAALCRAHAAELLLNAAGSGALQMAQALGCGLHLDSARLLAATRRPLPAGVPLAASCHDAAQLQQAQRLGCDFVVLGPVALTASHPDATPLGWSRFRALREDVELPIYALGGMRPQHISEARRHGAQGIAAIRGLWPAPAEVGADSVATSAVLSGGDGER